MKHTPGLWTIILTLLLSVTLLLLVGQSRPMPVWDKRLMPPRRVRQAFNPRKNRQRWMRRLAKRQRQRPQSPHPPRRRHRKQLATSRPSSASGTSAAAAYWKSVRKKAASRPPKGFKTQRATARPEAGTDPLAKLRQKRGMVDLVPERELWAMLVQVRWPHGPECPHCGERGPRYLKVLDEGYRAILSG